MKASILDLRYKTKEILASLARNETVKVYYHGKLKGTIYPTRENSKARVTDSPFFGMLKNAKKSVDDLLSELRGPRHVI